MIRIAIPTNIMVLSSSSKIVLFRGLIYYIAVADTRLLRYKIYTPLDILNADRKGRKAPARGASLWASLNVA